MPVTTLRMQGALRTCDAHARDVVQQRREHVEGQDAGERRGSKDDLRARSALLSPALVEVAFRTNRTLRCRV